MFVVMMCSDVYGCEEFEYDTLKEAEAGLLRLTRSVRAQQKVDGIERHFSVEEREEIYDEPGGWDVMEALEPDR